MKRNVWCFVAVLVVFLCFMVSSAWAASFTNTGSDNNRSVMPAGNFSGWSRPDGKIMSGSLESGGEIKFLGSVEISPDGVNVRMNSQQENLFQTHASNISDVVVNSYSQLDTVQKNTWDKIYGELKNTSVAAGLFEDAQSPAEAYNAAVYSYLTSTSVTMGTASVSGGLEAVEFIAGSFADEDNTKTLAFEMFERPELDETGGKYKIAVYEVPWEKSDIGNYEYKLPDIGYKMIQWPAGKN